MLINISYVNYFIICNILYDLLIFVFVNQNIDIVKINRFILLEIFYYIQYNI